MSPTIYDIARAAGVSKSTVSRVLNKQTNISPEALEKCCVLLMSYSTSPINLLAHSPLPGLMQ